MHAKIQNTFTKKKFKNSLNMKISVHTVITGKQWNRKTTSINTFDTATKQIVLIYTY